MWKFQGYLDDRGQPASPLNIALFAQVLRADEKLAKKLITPSPIERQPIHSRGPGVPANSVAMKTPHTTRLFICNTPT